MAQKKTSKKTAKKTAAKNPSPTTGTKNTAKKVAAPAQKAVELPRVAPVAPGKTRVVARFDCGFGNLANFNRRFREQKGCAPLAFRARFALPSSPPGTSRSRGKSAVPPGRRG